MKYDKDGSFAGRRETSLNAKKQLLERIRSAPVPDQAQLDRKNEEKAAAALAREAERERTREAKAQQLLADEEASAQAEADALKSQAAEVAVSAEAQAAAEAGALAMRVPIHPPQPVQPIVTVRQHFDAGLVIVSHCSAFPATHQHVVDLEAALRVHDANLDHEWKRSQTCPVCGAPGGGISVGENC